MKNREFQKRTRAYKLREDVTAEKESAEASDHLHAGWRKAEMRQGSLVSDLQVRAESPGLTEKKGNVAYAKK